MDNHSEELDIELMPRLWEVGEKTEWLADKIVIFGDYGKEAAFELIRLAQFEREHTKNDGGMMKAWDW